MDIGFYIGDKLIPYYGLMIATGILAAGAVGFFLTRHFKISFDNLLIIAGYGVLFGLVGAKLLYFLVARDEIEWDRFFELEYFKTLIGSGFVFYGGLIFGLGALTIVKFVHKIDVLEYMKICIPCIPIAHGFGRIGCNLVGCCYGKPFDSWFSRTYTASAFAPNNISLFPVQLTEAIAEFIIAAFLIVFILKKGSTIVSVYIYLYSYAALRFVLEYFRYDTEERGGIGIFSTSQIVSILIVVGLTAFIICKHYLDRDDKKAV